jgi:hypothetical protein
VKQTRCCYACVFLAPLLILSALVTPVLAANSYSPGKLLLASDIHFNPMADATLVPELVNADPSHWEATLQRSQPRQFSSYGQDTNWWLLQSALDQMHKTMRHPAVFLITGDLLAHGFQQKFQASTHDSDPQHYREFVQKTVQFLALELRRRWSDTQILVTPGNNDDDCQDYSIYAGGAFLSDTAAAAQELAKGEQRLAADWQALGSYTVAPPTIGGLQIVSVNTVFFSAKYQAHDFRDGCTLKQSNAADDTFAWLEQKLSAAKQARQRVWLMFHIPPGIDGYGSTHPSGGPVPPVGEECVKDIVPMWTPDWTARFGHLLETYRDTVIATFAGHTHTDSFMVMGTRNSRQFLLIDPPISPVYQQNPAFRVMAFSRDSEVQTYTTYYLTNLTTDKKLRGRWKKEYEFAREWKLRPVNAANLGTIYSEITTSGSARQKWVRLLNVSSDAVRVPPAVVPGLYCAIEGLSVDEYAQCACSTTK